MPRERAQLPESPIPRGFLDEVGTLTEAIVRLGREHPDYPCLIFSDHTGREEILTLGSLLARATAIQAAVEDRGLEPGDPAVLILPTGSELVAAYFGVLLAGGIPALASTPTQRAAEPAAYRRLIGGMLASGPARIAYCDEPTAAILSAGASIIPCAGTLLLPSDVALVSRSAAIRAGPLASIPPISRRYAAGSAARWVGVDARAGMPPASRTPK